MSGTTPLVEWIRLVREAQLLPRSKFAGLVLATYMQGHKLCCWPERGTLATDMGVSERTVRRATADLAAAGLLTVRLGGRGRSNTYTAVIPARKVDTDGHHSGLKGGQERSKRGTAQQGEDLPFGKEDADDAATAGAASPSARTNASRTSANGSTPCRVDGCDGWHHTLTDPVQPCPQRRTA